jgi:hypothetical protein
MSLAAVLLGSWFRFAVWIVVFLEFPGEVRCQEDWLVGWFIERTGIGDEPSDLKSSNAGQGRRHVRAPTSSRSEKEAPYSFHPRNRHLFTSIHFPRR